MGHWIKPWGRRAGAFVRSASLIVGEEALRWAGGHLVDLVAVASVLPWVHLHLPH